MSESFSHEVPSNPEPKVRISAEKLRRKRAAAQSADGAAAGGGRKGNQTSIPVRTPDRQWWVRTHRDPSMSVPVDILIVNGGENEGTWYLDPETEFPDELDQYIRPAKLVRSITHDGTEFFYLVKESAKCPKESVRRCIAAAWESWIQVRWNPTAKGYDYVRARKLRREPAWSSDTMDELLDKAFGDRYIDRADHTVVNALLCPEDGDNSEPEEE